MTKTGLIFSTIDEIPNAVLQRSFGALNVWKEGNSSICLIVSGIGQEKARTATRALCQAFNPDYIISSGICGGIKADLNIGDLVLAESVHYQGVEINLNSPQLNPFRRLLSELGYQEGKFQTFDELVTSRKNVYPDTIAVDLESYAVADEARKFSAPLVIVRTIADIVGYWELTNENFFHARGRLDLFYRTYFAALHWRACFE